MPFSGEWQSAADTDKRRTIARSPLASETLNRSFPNKTALRRDGRVVDGGGLNTTAVPRPQCAIWTYVEHEERSGTIRAQCARRKQATAVSVRAKPTNNQRG